MASSNPASLNELNVRVTLCTIGSSVPIVNEISSVPKNCAITAANVPPIPECPEAYDGNGGVNSSSCTQFGSAVVNPFSSVAAWRIPATGRHRSMFVWYLLSHTLITVSAREMFSSANRRARSCVVSPSCSESTCAVSSDGPAA